MLADFSGFWRLSQLIQENFGVKILELKNFGVNFGAVDINADQSG
jgi:hypothetical protein